MPTPASLDAPRFHTRQRLRRDGWTDRQIAAAVGDGRLLRPRSGAFVPPDIHPDLLDSCAQGGRLACVSELHRRGVFVLDHSVLHIHLHEPSRNAPKASRTIRRHWHRLRRAPHPHSIAVEPFDAVACAVRCQTARAALATLDSALRLRILDPDDLDDLFHVLPQRYGVLRRLIDVRAESGPETLVRLMLRALGVPFEVQVVIDGVGRVDFVVADWLIVECDSDEHHSGWDRQRRDRRRDQAAAALGYATYRPIAEDIMWHPQRVRDALAGLLAGRRRGRR